MIRSLPLVRRTLFLSVCGLFLFSGRLFAGNPLLMPSEAPYGAPRFDRIHAADIMPAIEEGIRAYKAGIAKIRALDPAEATFENVVVPLDRADSLLDVPRAVLGYLKSNFGGDSVIRISLESAQLTGEAYDAVTLDTAIFRLVKAVYDRRDAAGLDSLQLRTLGKVYRSYIRGGALCTPGQKERLKELKYLDDVRYAADFVSTRLATKPLSRRKLKEQLRTHYLSADDIDAAMEQVTDDVERRNAMAVAEKIYRQFEGLEEYDRRQRIVRRLAGRGYDFGVIRDSVEELIGAIDCPIESDGEDEE